jgi:hypothetical protein
MVVSAGALYASAQTQLTDAVDATNLGQQYSNTLPAYVSILIGVCPSGYPFSE